MNEVIGKWTEKENLLQPLLAEHGGRDASRRGLPDTDDKSLSVELKCDGGGCLVYLFGEAVYEVDFIYQDLVTQ